MENLDINPVIEELEAIEEVDNETGDQYDVDFSLLNEQGSRHWMNIFLQSPVPLILIDPDLRIIWTNEKFPRLLGLNMEFVGKRLDWLFFSDEKESGKLSELVRNIKSQKNSYYWHGKIEKKNKHQLPVITNLLILPVFKTIGDLSPPIAYACLFDNISDEYKEILKITFLSLLEASRLKDNDMGNHIERVNHFSRLLSLTLYGDIKYPEVNQDYIDVISFVAGMHDVGKIGTPDDILNKPGPLDSWEWEIMKEHTKNGAYILNTYPNPMAKEIALYHHEWWDGTGYPYGWVKEMIPLCARIVAITDVYDALRMGRSYKGVISHKEAMEEILRGKGNHFDPELVERFRMIEKDFERIFEELKD